jgi:hypothetical protein
MRPKKFPKANRCDLGLLDLMNLFEEQSAWDGDTDESPLSGVTLNLQIGA